MKQRESNLNPAMLGKFQAMIEFLVSSGFVNNYTELAKLFGVTISTVHFWRNGTCGVRLKKFEKAEELIDEARRAGYNFDESAYKKAVTISNVSNSSIENIANTSSASHTEPVSQDSVRLAIIRGVTAMTDLSESQQQRLIKIILEA